MKKAIAGVAIVLVSLLGFGMYNSAQHDATYDTFATCLTEKGAVFYGAYWCPHCQRQKNLFGDSKKLLPYVECSTPDGKGQTEQCNAANVEGYPTWVFADGSRLSGEVSLESLGEKTGCLLPVSDA